MGYIRINSFFDDARLTVQLWERAIGYLNGFGVPGVVIDMRTNGGGSGWLALQMAAYFFKQRLATGTTAYYDPSSGTFFADPGNSETMIPPPAALQYRGKVAVMVGPGCFSACEFFSHYMTIRNRASIVGQYPTNGAGGSVDQFVMPDDLFVQITIGRILTPKGKVMVEGKGVVPTVDVPVSRQSILRQAAGEDVVLSAAQKVLER